MSNADVGMIRFFLLKTCIWEKSFHVNSKKPQSRTNEVIVIYNPTQELSLSRCRKNLNEYNSESLCCKKGENRPQKMESLDEIINRYEQLKINEEFSECLYRKWVKFISFDKEIKFDEFTLNKNFKKVASVVIDNDVKRTGEKIRNTVIKFVPENIEDWDRCCEWIYMFTINGRIAKIGGTRTGLKKRASSYLCGHHIPERNKSGKCSVTNAHIYNTFDFYLSIGCEIIMYGYKIPQCKVCVTILDESIDVEAQVYHAYEAKFLNEYRKKTGKYPFLSNNADPKYT